MRNLSSVESKKYGFIITKPLQLMVVMAIIEQLPDEVNKELIVVDAFFGAKRIAEKLTTLNPKWRQTVFFEKQTDAFAYCRNQRYDNFFLDSDVGVLKNFDLLRMKILTPRTRISVYEEGLGSYRRDLYSGIKKKILALLGVGVFFGGNWLTSEIYLFHPNDYVGNFGDESLNVVKIEMLISELILKYESDFDRLFDLTSFKLSVIGKFSNEACNIYLTGWNSDGEAMQWLEFSNSCRVVKFHPHIKKMVTPIVKQFDVSVSPAVPAEMLITLASKIFKQVTVLHHGSSVVRYLNIKNVDFILVESIKNLVDIKK